MLVPLTEGISKPEGKRILSHSFRSGIPTLIAQAGYSDSKIQHQGRRRSSAFLAYCKLGRAARWKDQLTLSQRISSLYIRCVLGIEPNPVLFVDNSDSDDEACSDLDDDYSVVDDSLLGDSVTFATGPSSTPSSGKRRRNSVHFEDQGSSRTPVTKPVAQRAPAALVVPARRDAGANPPVHSIPKVSMPSSQTAESPQYGSVTNT